MPSRNSKNSAVRRIMQELAELAEPTSLYSAHALDDDIFEIHWTIRGPSDGGFKGGIYHGRMLLPAEYPFKPPSVIFLTPNGRFKVGKKICLSISAHHPETWNPSWSIRTALVALIGFMPTPGEGAIGALDYTEKERAKLAAESVDWTCKLCGRCNRDELLPEADGDDPLRDLSELERKGLQEMTIGVPKARTQEPSGAGGASDEPTKDDDAAPIITASPAPTPSAPDGAAQDGDAVASQQDAETPPSAPVRVAVDAAEPERRRPPPAAADKDVRADGVEPRQRADGGRSRGRTHSARVRRVGRGSVADQVLTVLMFLTCVGIAMFTWRLFAADL